MALDKLVDSAKLDGALSATADAIRSKTSTTGDIKWNESTGFASEISGIQVQPKLQSKTATPKTTAQTIKPDSGYDGLSQVKVNAIPSTYKRVATGTFTTDSSNGNPKTNPISVSGLGFTPTRVIAYLDYDHNYALGSLDCIFTIDLTASTTKITYGFEGSYCEYCEEASYGVKTSDTTAVYATMSSDGFTINGTTGNFQFLFAIGEKYQYIAIG